MKGLEVSGDGSEGDSDIPDAIAAQVLANFWFLYFFHLILEYWCKSHIDLFFDLKVRRLALEVRQLASSRQITVMNGVSGGMLS